MATPKQVPTPLRKSKRKLSDLVFPKLRDSKYLASHLSHLDGTLRSAGYMDENGGVPAGYEAEVTSLALASLQASPDVSAAAESLANLKNYSWPDIKDGLMTRFCSRTSVMAIAKSTLHNLRYESHEPGMVHDFLLRVEEASMIYLQAWPDGLRIFNENLICRLPADLAERVATDLARLGDEDESPLPVVAESVRVHSRGLWRRSQVVAAQTPTSQPRSKSDQIHALSSTPTALPQTVHDRNTWVQKAEGEGQKVWMLRGPRASLDDVRSVFPDALTTLARGGRQFLLIARRREEVLSELAQTILQKTGHSISITEWKSRTSSNFQ